MNHFLTFGAAIAACSTGQAVALQGSSTIVLNEIRIDQDGGDTDEYFELLSSPGNISLDGLTYIVIGDSGSTNGGIIEAVVDLTGSTTNSMGLFTAAESTYTIGTADLMASLNFENGDSVTHMIVEGFSGMPNDDLDVDEDGVLDTMPWTRVVDSVGIAGADSLFTYAAALGGNEVGFNLDGSTAEHIFRCVTAVSDWRVGLDDITLLSDTPNSFNGNCTATTDVFCDPGEPNEFSPTGGKMGFQGTFSIQLNDTTLICQDVPDNFGLFAQADMMGAPVMASIGGNVCLAGTVERMNRIVLPAMNVASLPLDVSDAGLVESAATAGSTFFYQYFHRDTTMSGGGNYSNGLMVTWTL